jgi:hypothetical protein
MNKAFYKANQKKKYVGPDANSFKQLWAIAKKYENKLRNLEKELDI